MAISDGLDFALEGAVGSKELKTELVTFLNGAAPSTNLNAVLSDLNVAAAAAAAGLSTQLYYNQAITLGSATDIRILIRAAIKQGAFDIKQRLINAYDAVHSRKDPKIAKNIERFVVTQAQLNQQFIDLQLSPMSGSARLTVNNQEMIEGIWAGGFVPGTGVAAGSDYQMNYAGKYPTIYRIYNEVSAKERTTVLINNTGTFFDTSGAAGKYFTIDSGSPDAPHYFWFKATDASSPAVDPVAPGTGFVVNILLADTAAQIATKLNTVVTAQSTLFTSTVATATVTITNVNIGAVAIATAATSGTTITRTVLGITSNLNNKYMALAGGYTNSFVNAGQADAILWFSVDNLGDSEVVYATSQSSYETKLNGMVPIKISISSGATALTIATAIATTIRQNMPNFFAITEPSATLAVYQGIGSTTNGSTSIIMTVPGDIAPGMPISGTGIPANTLVASISGSTIILNNAATITQSGVQLTFSYLPIKVYEDEFLQNGVDKHIVPVSTLVNTGGKGFNYSNCFQVIGANGFDNSFVEPGGRIGFLPQDGIGGRNLSTISSPGTITTGSNRVSSFNMPYRFGGGFWAGLANGYFVSGTGIPSGTVIAQNNVANYGSLGMFSVKRISGTRDFSIVDANGNPTTIAAYQAFAAANPTVLNGTLATVTSTGDLSFGNTTINNIVTTGIVSGMLVQGPYIPGGTTVTSVGASSLVISAASLATYTAQTLLFGSCTSVATQVQTCSITNGSPYFTIATGTPNICHLMAIAGTGINAAAIVMNVSISGGTTTVTMSHNATVTNASASLTFSPSAGMLVSGTGIPAGTFVITKAGTTFGLSSIPTSSGVQSLSFQPYFPTIIPGTPVASNTTLLSVDQLATTLTSVVVRIYTSGGGDVISGSYELFNDNLMYPFGLRVTGSNDMVLNQPVTANSSAALSINVVNPTPGAPQFNLTTPLKLNDIVCITYDVDDNPIPEYHLETLVPYAGSTWDGTDATIDTWYQNYTSTINMPYKVKGEGVPILFLSHFTSSDGDMMGQPALLGQLPTGRVYTVAPPGFSRPWGPSLGGFTESQLLDIEAWRNNSPGNPVSDFRMSSCIRAIGSLIERFNCGPMILAGNTRNAFMVRCLYTARPDLFRSIVEYEPFDHNFTTADAYLGSGPVSLWSTVGIPLAGTITNGSNVMNMGSGGNNYTLGIYNGMPISGNGILTGTIVSSFTNNSVTMSSSAKLSSSDFFLFGGTLNPNKVASNYIYEYCASNDTLSSNPNIITGTVTAGSNIITGITDTTKFLKGMSLTGTGINTSDTPIGCNITSGSATISGISATDIAKIKVGMYIYGGGFNAVPANFTQNVLTLATTNIPTVVSVGVSSVVVSQTASVTNTAAVLWFIVQIQSVTPTTITMTSPAFASSSNVSIRGRMLNRDSNFYRLMVFNSKKKQEMFFGAYKKTVKIGMVDNLQTAQAYSGGGNLTWAQTNGVLPAPTSFIQRASYTQTPVVTQADDGTHPNLFIDTSTFPNFDWSTSLMSFGVPSFFNPQSTNVGVGAPVAFDNGSGPGIDQGSGVYRSISLSQPFKFFGGRNIGTPLVLRNSLAQGETSQYALTFSKILVGYGNDLLAPTAKQLKARTQGIPVYRLENSANLWTFTNSLSGWCQSIAIAEALQWIFGPSLITLGMNPYNDVASGPIPANGVTTYLLNQFIGGGSTGFAGGFREWQVDRNFAKPQL